MAKRIAETDDPEVRRMLAEATHCLNCDTLLKYHQRKDGRRNYVY